jgi:hypothetical protein
VQHHCEIHPDLNVNGFSTAVCSACRFMTGDGTEEEVSAEARAHEVDPEQPKLEPWDPTKHPTPNR